MGFVPQTIPADTGEFTPETPDWVKPIIQRYAEQFGVPTKLLSALLNQESGFNPQAVSPAGAQGIAQFMPGTARAYNVNVFDPESSIRGAAQHLSDLYRQFGSWELALAGYNAGAGAVQQYGGIPPFTETQRYVPAIMGRL